MKQLKTDDNYSALAKGIVTQGVEDYKKTLKKKWALEQELMMMESELLKLRQFFHSEWCHMLSDIDDPKYITDNATITAKKELKDEKVGVTVRIKPKKEEKTKKSKSEEVEE